MSGYAWKADTESDAQRIANAALPTAFWKALAGLAGDLVPAAPAGEFKIDGDVLTFGRSSITVARSGHRIAALPMKTVMRANALAKNKAKAATEAKTGAPAIIEWEP